jgi:hypothetical protein
MRLVLGSLVLTSLTAFALVAGGCDEKPTGAARRSAKAAEAPTAVGTWALDADAFVAANRGLFLAQAQPAIDRLRESQAKIEKLPPSEKEKARAQVQASIRALPEQHQAAVRAALVGREALDATLKDLVLASMKGIEFRIELRADKGCVVEVAMPGKPASKAEGTWSTERNDVVVTLHTVDGQPAKAKDAKPVRMSLRDDELHLQLAPKAPVLVAKRV